jgi:UDP-N-acetylglucosamine--N-acetylmuramyl-(pentapeptide) pyrophosphoryl-undecaprenol N-acetylglucosamine transferase
VREEIFKARKEEAIEFFGLKEDLKTLLVMGGSQGSVKLNEALLKSLPAFARFRPLQIIHLTGEANFEEVKKEFEEKKEQLNFPDELVYRPFPYLEEIGLAYAAADLVLCRAGATTISELMALGKPAILVPYPWATDNHQEENARAVERRGAGRVILEKDLTPIVLFEEVKRVIYNETALRLMGQRARWLSRREADRAIVEIILSLKQASEILQSATEETEESEEWEWLTR